MGGDRFDESIVAYVRRNYGSLIGDATAERIKQEIGTAYPGSELREIDVRGRNLAEGIPRSFTLNSREIQEALEESARQAQRYLFDGLKALFGEQHGFAVQPAISFLYERIGTADLMDAAGLPV